MVICCLYSANKSKKAAKELKKEREKLELERLNKPAEVNVTVQVTNKIRISDEQFRWQKEHEMMFE